MQSSAGQIFTRALVGRSTPSKKQGRGRGAIEFELTLSPPPLLCPPSTSMGLLSRLRSPLITRSMSTSFISSPSSSRITRPVPPQRPGMTVLDRTAFDVKLTTLAGRIPASKTGTVKALKILKGSVLRHYFGWQQGQEKAD